MIYAALQFALSILQSSTVPTSTPCTGSFQGRVLRTEFIDGLIFAHWHLRSGEDLRFYLDTGGNTWFYPEAVPRLGAAVDTTVRNGYSILSVRMSGTLGDSLVLPVPVTPAAAGSGDTVAMMVSPEPAPDLGIAIPVDGLLGGYWFADRVWVLDYPRQRLLFNGAVPTGPSEAACWVPLGFQTYPPTGRRTTQFPRIEARIDGEVIQFLLDTGAQTTLTDSAWQTVGPDEPRRRATSFITQSRFSEWRQHHPDWLVVPRAEAGDSASMIRVPTIRVGGQDIGPVWFTVRPDQSFREFMSQYMDEPVEGALGGSAWKYVTLILDYPRARAAVLASPR
jgi:hypothetical protein